MSKTGHLEENTKQEGTANNGECVIPVRLQPLVRIPQILLGENIIQRCEGILQINLQDVIDTVR